MTGGGGDKPWDARLVEWMSRGSDKAGGRRGDQWTPRQRAAYFLVWVTYYVVWLATGSVHWWLAAGGLALATAIEVMRWRRRRGS